MKTVDPNAAKYVAVVRNVKELRLIGAAGLNFWKERCRDEPFQAFADCLRVLADQSEVAATAPRP